ncbi:glycosyltransferase family 4 protein [Vibrio sp. FNV 38]|nr:glycosyltransferase family 4 protein [Vibrio sp. FNV 38]
MTLSICHVNLAKSYNGGENQAYELIKHQLTLGYSLTVVARLNSPFANAIEALGGCKIISARHFSDGQTRLINQQNCVVHVHEGRSIYWALLQKWLHGTPYVITRRIDNPLKPKLFNRLAYGQAAAVIGLSHAITSNIKKFCSKLEPYLIPDSPISYPCSSVTTQNIRTRFTNKILIIQAANMLAHKGFDVTIECARQLSANEPDLHFVLIGDGDELPSLKQRAQGLRNVTFVGRQYNMGDWFSAADIFAHPAYSEGMGSVILEAMQAQLPVVASNVGGIPDVITHNDSGILIPPGDSIQLANAIVKLTNNASFRHGLVKRANQELERFSIERTAALYQQLYLSVSPYQKEQRCYD